MTRAPCTVEQMTSVQMGAWTMHAMRRPKSVGVFIGLEDVVEFKRCDLSAVTEVTAGMIVSNFSRRVPFVMFVGFGSG